MVKWTTQQQQAIELRDKNILVSAAAGSGKTAVLVERIKQLILRDRIPLDRFLIVTFTNAAAAEMKEKLVDAITKAIEEDPSHASFLRRQLDLAANANISTFHSFALEVIRRYFYLIDVEPDFKIGDEGAIEILKWDVLDQIFAERFESGEEEFLDFLRAYASDRNERALKEAVLKLYTTIQSIPHPLSWLAEHVRKLDMNPEDFPESALAAFIKEDLLSASRQILRSFEQAGEIAQMAGVESVYQKNLEDLEKLEPLLQMAERGDFEGARKLVSSFKANVMRASKEEKEDYEPVKEEIKSARDYGKKQLNALKERYFEREMKDYLDDMKSVGPAARYLEELIKEFDQAFRRAKQEKKLIDFNDIEHYALEILEHEEAAAEYRAKFECIFVDEYQDSNVLQDTLIDRIRRENNLFLVGDIKQSIYKFRLAEPEIFQARYKAYASERETCSMKLDLNRNFRSKKSVIETVNAVFSEVMAGYDEAAALYQGVAYDGPIDWRTQLHIIDSRVSEEMDLDEEIAEMKNSQLEAFQAAGIIKGLLGKPIFDSKRGCERPIRMRDIVILMRGTKNYADVFQEVFTELDLPSYMDDSGGYFDTVEIQVFLNLLRLIDNKQQDLPLLSVLRSAVFGFSIEELIQIRLDSRTTSYYEAFCRCSRGEGALAQKCGNTLETLERYRKMAQALPLEEFIWELMWSTGYYTYCGSLPAGQQRQANLRALADKARDFKSNGYGGIYSFLTYIQALENRRIPTGQVKLINENEDLIRIMTIHKSKGLEFPVVIVAGLGKRFNTGKTGKGFLAHKDLGLGITKVNYWEHWHRKTLMQTAIERKLRQEDLDEEIRILYVAFTRAMDQLILLGTVKTGKDGKLPSSPSRNCFLDYLLPLARESGMEVFWHDRGQMTAESRTRGQNREEVRELLFAEEWETENPVREEIERRLSFVYPNQQALARKSKYSVTELSRAQQEAGDEEIVLKTPAFLQGSLGFTAAQRGTIMHKVMECVDFKEMLCQVEAGTGPAYVSGQVQRMLERELLLPEEAEAVECEKIAAFFQHEIGARAAGAENLYKETEFNLLKEIDGTEVMVQGIIDCYFEEADHLILIDYKNSYVNPQKKEEELERLRGDYAGQIAIYKEALEVIRQKPVDEAYLYLFGENQFLDMN